MHIRLLKKAPIARALNVSGREFERKLEEGLIPSPHCWVSDNKRGRRWSSEDIARVFAIDLAA